MMTTQLNPHEGMVVDGYRFLRSLGQGGFGVVWLVYSEASKSFHALKWVAGSQGVLETELSAVRRFRETSQRLRYPSLIAIEHINLSPAALFYTMPLADGGPGDDPSQPGWSPVTLADLLAVRKKAGSWFSSQEIVEFLQPVSRAASLLNGEGLVHRDIKPANILFIKGLPCLSDIGLLSRDGDTISIRGTPGFMPPSWFLETHGEVDLWGLATTLYTLLTGQNPDTMGKARYRQPPQGFGSLSPSEQRQWKRLYKLIDKATEEKPTERFLSLQSFTEALGGVEVIHPVVRQRYGYQGMIGLTLGIIGLFAWFLPILGLPITVLGLVLSLRGLNTGRRDMSVAGLTMSVIGLVLSIMNMSIGAYQGWHMGGKAVSKLLTP